jgi:hypothetical protein
MARVHLPNPQEVTMEPLVPLDPVRRRYPLGFMLLATAVGIAGWAPQPNRLEDTRPAVMSVEVRSATTGQGQSDAARPAEPLRWAVLADKPATQTASSMAPAVQAPVSTATAALVMLPPPRPASAPSRKDTLRSAQANAEASLIAEIGHFKAVLKLTPSQEQYWPPVDAVLRELAREQAPTVAAAMATGAGGRAAGKLPKLTIGEADMNRLASAAFPLMMTLNEEQKRDAAQFARAMGLERVASAL